MLLCCSCDSFSVVTKSLYLFSDYIFDYLSIITAVGGFAVVSTINQALKYTFKVHIHMYIDVYSCGILYA